MASPPGASMDSTGGEAVGLRGGFWEQVDPQMMSRGLPGEERGALFQEQCGQR